MNNIIKYGSISAIPLYNCSAITPEGWSKKLGVRRPFLGIAVLAYGVLINIVYTLIIRVMFERKFFKISCFKIMIFLGIADMLVLVVSSIVTGLLLIEGAVYCTHPHSIYIFGMAGLGLWCCSCMLALTLVINRLIDLTKPHLVKVLFGGNRTFIVLTFPILYGSYFVIFTTPATFSSNYMAWFFDPMIFDNMSNQYTNFPHVLNNILVVASTCMLYIVLCSVIGKKIIAIRNGNSKAQKLSAKIFFQSSLICAANQMSSIIYVIMNYIEVPLWLIMLGHVLWQFGSGAPAIIYLVLNRPIRTSFLKIIGYKGNSQSTLWVQSVPPTMSTLATSSYMSRVHA